MKCLEGYCNFCNKLWNVVCYVLMNIEGEDCGVNDELVELFLVDCWIISELQICEQEVICYLDQYCFDLVVYVLYEFIWNEYCDWYLELFKLVLNDDGVSVEVKCGICCILVWVLEVVLWVVYLIMLFIIEEIWQCIVFLVGKFGDSIMLQLFL